MVKAFNLTLSEALNKASLFLREKNHDETLARTYWMMTFDLTLTDIVLGLNKPINEESYKRYMQVLEQIVQDVPIQYILGYAYFMDHKFKVNQHTLIPREDTVGIVDLASQVLKSKPSAKVLDIGTGTGILAIMIAKANPRAKVTAIDISKEALLIAEENAKLHQTNIQFIESDLLNELSPQKFDIIVSNPPYIGEDELELLDESVKKYEPSLALFAEDEGLAIYKRMAEEVQDFVDDSSIIILEIGFKQGEKVRDIFQHVYPTASINVLQDLNGKDRYVQVQL